MDKIFFFFTENKGNKQTKMNKPNQSVEQSECCPGSSPMSWYPGHRARPIQQDISNLVGFTRDMMDRADPPSNHKIVKDLLIGWKEIK